MFGKETIANIRTDIYLQVITKSAKVVGSVQKLVKSIKVPFVDISTLITLLDNQDFKDVIVCFDDFERLSKSLQLKEVLGFLSELKEKKKCKIVMIFNKEIFDYLTDEDIMLEDCLTELTQKNMVSIYHHKGFWHSLDTYRDYLKLNKMWKDKKRHRLIWKNKISTLIILTRVINKAFFISSSLFWFCPGFCTPCLVCPTCISFNL